MSIYANIVYQIPKTIIFRIADSIFLGFDVIFAFLSVEPQKSIKPLSATSLKSHPFLLHWPITVSKEEYAGEDRNNPPLIKKWLEIPPPPTHTTPHTHNQHPHPT